MSIPIEKQTAPPQSDKKKKTFVAGSYNYHSAAAGGSPCVSPLLSTSSIVIVDESPRQ